MNETGKRLKQVLSLCALLLPLGLGCGGGGTGVGSTSQPQPGIRKVVFAPDTAPNPLPPDAATTLTLNMHVEGTPGSYGIIDVTPSPALFTGVISHTFWLTRDSEDMEVRIPVHTLDTLREGSTFQLKFDLHDQGTYKATKTVSGVVGAYPPKAEFSYITLPIDYPAGGHVTCQTKVRVQGPLGHSAKLALFTESDALRNLRIAPSEVQLAEPRSLDIQFDLDVAKNAYPRSQLLLYLYAEDENQDLLGYTSTYVHLGAFPSYEMSLTGFTDPIAPGSTTRTTLNLSSLEDYRGVVRMTLDPSVPGLSAIPPVLTVDLQPGEVREISWTLALDAASPLFTTPVTFHSADDGGIERSWTDDLSTMGAPKLVIGNRTSTTYLRNPESRVIPIEIRSENGFQGRVTLGTRGFYGGFDARFLDTEVDVASNASTFARLQVSYGPPNLAEGNMIDMGAFRGGRLVGLGNHSLWHTEKPAVEIDAPVTKFFPIYPEPFRTTLTVRSVHGATGPVSLRKGQYTRFEPESIDLAPDGSAKVDMIFGENPQAWVGYSSYTALIDLPVSSDYKSENDYKMFEIMTSRYPALVYVPPQEPWKVTKDQWTTADLEFKPIYGLSGSTRISLNRSGIGNIYVEHPIDVLEFSGVPIKLPIKLINFMPAPENITSGQLSMLWNASSSQGESFTSQLRVPFVFEVPGKPAFALLPDSGVIRARAGEPLSLRLHLYSLGGYTGTVKASLAGPCNWTMSGTTYSLSPGDHRIIQANVTPGALLSPGEFPLFVDVEDGSTSQRYECLLIIER